MRVKAVIAYNGSAYHGFQKQNSTAQTITTTIEKALQSLKIDSPITGSGRTDAGVHATGQVIHFDLPDFWQDFTKLKLHLNRRLTRIAFKHITPVEDSFHARFSARKRLYRYVFKTQKPSVFEAEHIACYPEFNRALLLEALHCFEGVHDFKYFHKTGSKIHTTTREIYHANYLQRYNYHFIYFQANGFLRSQVRMMIEASMQYARGAISPKELMEQIEGQKKHSSRLAPPEGLYLARVLYA